MPSVLQNDRHNMAYDTRLVDNLKSCALDLGI